MISVDILKIPHKNLISAIFFIFAAVVTPYYFIFQFERTLYYKLDLVQMIMLSLAVGFPVVLVVTIINAIREMITEKLVPQKKIPFQVDLMTNCLIAAGILYIPCAQTLGEKMPLADAVRICKKVFVGFCIYNGVLILSNFYLFFKANSPRNSAKVSKANPPHPLPPADPGDI